MRRRMRIAHIVSGMQKASGVTVFVSELTMELRKLGHEVDIAVRGDPKEISGYDIVHVHGLWDRCLHDAARQAYQAGVPVVWSPHGMLQKWALKNKWWKKLSALALYQWHDLRSAAILHATAQSEVDDIRRIGLKNKVVIAPLGVRLPPVSFSARPFASSISHMRVLLFVSRVQKKKGLPNLIAAWSRLPQDLRANWQIRIVGPDQDNHTAELKSLCARLNLTFSDNSNSQAVEQSNIFFVGPKYGNDLAQEYQNADLFVLPTHSENFGSVVIEALAYGVPVITTKAAPWAELEGDAFSTHAHKDLSVARCGWWIDVGVDPLEQILRTAMSLSDSDRTSMGDRGRQLVQRKYSWVSVACALDEAYQACVG